MNESKRPDHTEQPASLEEKLRSIAKDFESAWQEAVRGGTPPKIGVYLADVSEPQRTEIRAALEQIGRRYRDDRGSEHTDRDTEYYSPESATVVEGPDSEREGTVIDAPVESARLEATVDFVAAEDDRGHAPGGSDKGELPAVPGYEILSVLGRGGMGVVYQARQKGLKRLVALKMVLAGKHEGAEGIARFHTEAEAVAQLQHPNIVQIHEVGEHSGTPFFSLEFVDGQSLDKKLNRKPMEAAEAAKLLETLARAMHYAHQRSIVHRDLKPSNVLLTSDGVPKISDFGLAKRLEDDSSQTRTGTIMGTPSYMAPEQARGAITEIGPLADVYALGAILYELLTGRPPFVASTPLDTVMQVLNEEPVPPTRLQTKVSADLETICLKCLQKDSRKRYGSAEELAADLRRFSAGEPILARPVSNWERFRRWCRRNPRVAGLSGVAVLLALTIVIGSPVAVLQINQEKNAAIVAKEEADENAEAALKAQRAAQDAETLAEEKAQVATEQAALALDAYQTLIGEVHDQLAGRPAMQELKQALLGIAVSKLNEVTRSVDNANLIDKEMAKAHQKMGWLFEDLGQTSLALERHQKAHEIIQALADENPDDPIAAKRNPAGTVNKLGDMSARLGELAEARRHYLTALQLRKEWVQIDPKQWSAKLAVANSYSLIGGVDLQLGDPAAARLSFLESVKWREQIPDEVNRLIEVLRQRSGLYDRLGETGVRLGEAAETERRYREALDIRQRVAKARPGNMLYAFDVLISYLNLGDLRLQLHDDASGAHEFYQQALELVESLREKDPHSAFVQRGLSLVNYRLGTSCLVLGRASQAKEHYEECLQHREALAQKAPEDVSTQIDLMIVLARCGHHEKAASMADDLHQRFATNPWVLYSVACCYSLCASVLSDDVVDGQVSDKQPALEQRYADQAMEAVRQAIHHGWKDVITLQIDSDLTFLRQRPGYQALLNRIETPAADSAEESQR